MGKLVTIATKARFDALREASNISETSLNFILETGLLYTHNIFINGASFGTATSNYIPVKIGGVIKNLSLNGHTHSNYYDNSSDIDIGSNKIKSGTLELLKYSSDTLILGNSSIPTEFFGTLKTTKDGTKYTILDTNNFSIVNKTSTNLTLNNVALFKYGSSSFLLDYVRRYNTVETFNNLAKYTSAGTTNENSKAYGFITLSTDTGTNTYSYAQIRVSIPDNTLEFRTSSDTTWKGTLLGGVYRNITINGTTYSIVTKAGSLPTIIAPTALGTSGQYLTTSDDGKSLTWRTLPTDNNTWRPIAVNGTEKRSSSTGSGNLDIINGTNTTVEWTSGNKLKINAVDTWTAWAGATSESNGVAGYMPAPTSAQYHKFLRGDGAWVSLNNYSLPTASNSTLGGVKTGAAITDTTGYTAVAIKDGVIYYKDTNTTYSFSNLLFLLTSGTNLMTYNSQAIRTVLAGSNITFTHSNNILTIAAKDTTYSTVSKSAAGLCPALPNETTTTKYLRLDGTWVTPPNDNTWKAANASQEGYVPKSTANKILRANADGTLYWGDDANTTYTFYNLLFQNSGGTTVDTYKPTTSPTKTLKAGSNVTISATSNVITIASTNTWNANAVGVAGYVAAPTKAANANMTWLTDAEGVPAWRASNNHSHSYLPLSGGQMKGPLTWKDGTALPEQTSPLYFVVIDAFASGGTTKWSSVANVKTALGLGSNAYTSTAYLPLAGGTMNDGAVIARSGKSGSWYKGRNHPIIKTTSYPGYNSILSMKTENGSWDLGVYESDTAYLTYITDTDYNANNNKRTYLLEFPKATGTLALTSQIPTKASWNYNDMYVASVSISGNNLRINKNGTNTDLTIPYATNADTVDSIHATGLLRWKGMLNIGSNAPFQAVVDIIKDITKLNDGGLAFYSYAGDEYTVLIGSRNDATRHGSALKWGYANKYLWMIRMTSGSPKSSDWEKISAGYADSAGSVAWANVSSKPETATRWPKWTEVTDKPSSFVPSAHDHTRILFIDDRNVVETPTDVAGKNGIEIHFKNKSISSIPSSGTWTAIVMLDGYSDISGGYPMELGFSMTDLSESRPLYLRTPKSATEWGDWRTILDSGNSSVSKSGETLTVKINGVSQSLTNSTYKFEGTTFYSGNSGNAEHNADNAVNNGHYYYTTNGPATSLGASTGDGALYVQSYSSSWVAQIAQDYRNGRLFIRGKNNGTWQSWVRIANYNEIPTNNNQLTNGAGYITSSANITGNAATATKATNDSDGNVINSTYLKKSGGTMSGTLNMTCNTVEMNFRTGHDSYNSKMEYMTYGNEAMVWANQSAVTSFIFKCGLDLSNTSDWTGITPSLQIKNLSVYINSLIANGTTPSYNLYVNGSANATTLYENGNRVITTANIGSQSVNYATSAGSTKKLASYYDSRPSTANLLLGDASLRFYEATSSMTEGKPTIGDSSIIHLSWDTNAGWDKQIAVGHGGNTHMMIRAQNNGTWGSWINILDSDNSSVSKSGSTLTVKINGTSQSITDTNTWRGIQDNLTSSSNTTESLSAKQGYLLANGSARDSTKIPLYRYGGTGSTTKIKININSTATWMLCFTVTLYQGYRATKIMISGYQYGSNHWYQPEARILGDSDGTETISVYFGYDDTNKLWVGFDGGSYTGVSINDVTNGYTQIGDFMNLFTISNVSSLATLQTTVTAASKANYANNADTTDGLHVHGGRNNEANKIVRTDGNGYIQCGWINTTSGNFTGTPDRIWASNDAYMRYMTPANFFPTLTNDSNQLSVTVGGQNRKVTIAYATSAGNADTVDYLHASDLFRKISNSKDINFADGNNKNGIIYVNKDSDSGTTTGFWGNYGSVLNINSSAASWQLGVESGGAFKFRHRWWSTGGNDWSGWSNIMTSSNCSVSLSGSTLTVKINGTSQSLTNTWRGITDSYSGTDSSISLSQKGGKALYDALVNGYASSAGNADTVDSQHATRFGWVYNSSNYGNSSSATVNDLASNGGSNATFGMVCSGTDNPTGSGSWVHVWSQQWNINVASNWVSLIAIGTQAKNGMWYRATGSSGGIAGVAWKRVIDSSNYSSYALPLSGGTVTGNVTIKGTANSDTALSLSGSQYTMDFLIGSGNVNRGIYNRNSNAWMFYFDASNTIMNYGNVGIGTTSPSYKLHVAGDIGTSGNIIISHAASATMTAASTNPKITFSESGSLPVHLTYTDYDSYRSPAGLKVVGGTDATPAWFEAEGNMYASNFYTTSDRNKKQNISSFSEHIRKFQLKDTEKWHYGVIAQEVEEMFRDGEEGNMTVNYNSVLSYYVGLLENKVASLEKELNSLKQKLK